MSYTYITRNDAINHLNNGKPIQQWLSFYEKDGFRFIKWIEVDPTNNGGWAIFEHDSLDCWDMECYDMGEFLDVRDYDEPEGKRTEFDNITALFDYMDAIGVNNDRFLRFCDIQWVYREFLEEHGPSAKGIKDWFS